MNDTDLTRLLEALERAIRLEERLVDAALIAQLRDALLAGHLGRMHEPRPGVIEIAPAESQEFGQLCVVLPL